MLSNSKESFGALLRWGQQQKSNSYTELLQILAYSCEARSHDLPFYKTLDKAFYEALPQKCAELLARTQEIAPPEVQQRYLRAVEAWKHGKPIEYILGFADFAGYSFAVGSGVLIPREDSETLLREALSCARRFPESNGIELDSIELNALDLCCGTFCVGLSWYRQLGVPCNLWGSDISVEALNYARFNRGDLPVHVVESDLFSAQDLQHKYHIIFANPPYLSASECERRSDWWEPRLALTAGSDGLTVLREIIYQSPSYLHSGGFLLLEAAPWQMHELKMLFRQQGFGQIAVQLDTAGHERVITGRLE